ncbi:hypothetical protein JK358_37565 [Nocardia sp. 2]|uniref:Uncharacterized protein n=1 Tax=Nocardia acididurans TaxID=2802282 RepID=A0ABS1MIH4_9NOCA|nr:hypothetical protein [Nocardia acididurans]MBL1080119.1 hypothetical protein [Nocardia acididurans]
MKNNPNSRSLVRQVLITAALACSATVLPATAIAVPPAILHLQSSAPGSSSASDGDTGGALNREQTPGRDLRVGPQNGSFNGNSAGSDQSGFPGMGLTGDFNGN